MVLSSIFRSGITLGVVLVCLSAGVLWLKRPVESNTVIVCVKSSSLTGRSILSTNKMNYVNFAAPFKKLFSVENAYKLFFCVFMHRTNATEAYVIHLLDRFYL